MHTPIIRNGIQYDHVSAICKTVDDPAGLIAWAGRTGTDKMEAILEDSSDRGQAVHSALHAWFVEGKGLDGEWSEYVKVAEYWRASNLYEVNKELSEKSLVDDSLHLTGTPDLVFKTPLGLVAIGDWKTSSGFYHSHLVQGAGYKYLLAHALSDKAVTAHAIHILRFEKLEKPAKVTLIKELKRTTKYTLEGCSVALIELKRETDAKLDRMFMHALDIYRWRREEKV